MHQARRDSGASCKKPVVVQKLAMGGVAKIRHEQSNKNGAPKK